MKFFFYSILVLQLFAKDGFVFPTSKDNTFNSTITQKETSKDVILVEGNITRENILPEVVIEESSSPLDFNTSQESQENEKKNKQEAYEEEKLKLQEATKQNLITKNVYLDIVNPPYSILYVHQIIPITLKLLVLSQYSTIETKFILDNASVEVLNPKETWTLNQDSSLSNTFYFKINQPNFTIPKVEVMVNTIEGEFQESTDFITGRAIKLERKGGYSQVLAKDLKILDSKITNYDSGHNLVVLQLQSNLGNLFDFYLQSYQQGIESKSGDYKEAVAFYYAIVPKSLGVISFEYFNTEKSQYIELQVDNIPQDERVSTQSDIKPKNNIQFYQVSLIVFLALIFFGLYFYKRKWIFMLLGILLLVLLFFLLSVRTSAVLKVNTAIHIQPTFNSTIILITQEPMKVEVLSDVRDYYKVMLEDERIGWVRKNDIQD
ncbi:SH3 domain-containing protein [Helicobacter apodemus]|uniref:SH3 domain-containing protein n=1 Tax=Helicobacter apodemus TaxID=135569 RepID=A0A4U8UJ21_9HELI|nr:SH3 domain-containing protein [Helicobacter apodemus]TLE17267.1 SH3 domain-containing protein [Helicobacter apodemus]